MGVEEEFLLVDARSYHLAPSAEHVWAKAGTDAWRGTVHLEGTRHQVESATATARTTAELRHQLLALRRCLVRAAAAHGCRLVASATPVLPFSAPPQVSDVPRGREQTGRYGALTSALITCSCHVHIGTFDLDTAVRISDHLRPWLPTLIALSANSPFWNGRDTGHASWRAVAWGSWPSAGVPPRLGSATAYRRIVRTLIASGAAMDAGMVYWDMRPSSRWPTLELRAADVCTGVDEVVLQAAIGRALVTMALRAVREGRPPPRVRDEVLALARWRAARDGLEGFAVDPGTGTLLPAYALVDSLMGLLEADLRAAGDLGRVSDVLTALRRRGSGAYRQRRAYESRRNLLDVVRYLADATEDQER